MYPLTIEQYEMLIAPRHGFDPKTPTPPEPDIFPMTEEAAGNLLAACGFMGGHATLRHWRESGQAKATPEAWDRESVRMVADHLAAIESVKFDVFACYGLGVEYLDYQSGYLNACRRVREEYPWAAVAGMFGPQELVNPDWFEKTFLPPRLGRNGVAEFRLADDVREMLDAEKALRESKRDAEAYAELAARCAKTASERYFASRWPVWSPITNGQIVCLGDNHPFGAGPEWRERQIEAFRVWLKENGIEELASAYHGDDRYTFVMLLATGDLDAVSKVYQKCVADTVKAIGEARK